MSTDTMNTVKFENSEAFARQMDERDPLRSFRTKFHIPRHQGKEKIYFTGNSLGLAPLTAAKYMQQELDDWATLGGEGHFEARNPWYSYHELFTRQMASLAGCEEEEVVVMNSLTVNLHLLMASFYRPTKKRFRILCEQKAFPSDQYVFESQARLHGLDPEDAVIEVKPRAGEQSIHPDDILQAIDRHRDSLALVFFGGINYYTGQVFDMAAITHASHQAGAFCGFDLAHAVGNIELKLHDWNVDFAAWCTYKYLNAGPGSAGGVYIHKKHVQDPDLLRLAGWWGYDKQTRFRMEKGFRAMPTAEGWQLSNAPVFNMAPLKASLDIFEEAGMTALVKKSKMLNAYFLFLLEEINRQLPQPVSVITPLGKDEYGCQLSLVVKEKGRKVFEELMANGVSAGWREPEVIRVAPVPLYNSYLDVYYFMQLLKQAIQG